MKKFQVVVLAVLFSVGMKVTNADATPVTFTSEAAFLAAAAGIPLAFQGFETLVDGPSPTTLGPITLVSSDGSINVNPASSQRSEGAKSWGVGGIFGAEYPVSIQFSPAVNAVGFD